MGYGFQGQGQSARLCGEAAGGEILVSLRVQGALLGAGDEFAAMLEPAGKQVLKGLQRPVPAWRVMAAAPANGS